MMSDYDTRESGAQWLPQIPKDWKLAKVQHLLNVKDGTHDTPSYEATEIDNYPFVTSKDIDNNNINFSNTKFINKTYFDIYKKRSDVCFGDIVMPMIGTIGNSAIVSTDKEFAIKNLALFKTSESTKTDTRFFHYFLESKPNQDQFFLLSKGGVQSFLSLTTLRNLKLILPSIAEQKAIASYLDEACEKIDSTLSIKQQQLDKLEAYRKSIIHEAVTKGLDKNVAMKNSGVEWLGDIPEHWSSSQLKNFGLGTMTNGIFKKKEHFGRGAKLVNVTDLYQPDNIIDESTLDRVACSYDERNRYKVTVGDIFFVRSSLKMEGIAISSIALTVSEPTVFECHIVRFHPNKNRSDARFINYSINSVCIHHRLVALSKTVTMTTISQNKIASIKLAQPSKVEQTAIADHLDNVCEIIDKTKVVIESQVNKLTQYRQSLIHECVTGKKRVYQGDIN